MGHVLLESTGKVFLKQLEFLYSFQWSMVIYSIVFVHGLWVGFTVNVFNVRVWLLTACLH